MVGDVDHDPAWGVCGVVGIGFFDYFYYSHNAAFFAGVVEEGEVPYFHFRHVVASLVVADAVPGGGFFFGEGVPGEGFGF